MSAYPFLCKAGLSIRAVFGQNDDQRKPKMTFDYSHSAVPVREDIPEAFNEVWQTIAKPGNWWRGADRVAIASETRNARKCPLCAERKAALSPYSIDGIHQNHSNLPSVAVDAVHRLATDASRLTRNWIEKCEESGLSDGQYVELLGVVVAVISIDGFHRAMGFALEPLPEPLEGEPSRYRPNAKDHGSWVPTVDPSDVSPEEVDLYAGMPRVGNVISAMSLVPDSVRMMKRLSGVQYLAMSDVPNPSSNGGRTLSRPQIELLAGRVSSLSDCFY